MPDYRTEQKEKGSEKSGIFFRLALIIVVAAFAIYLANPLGAKLFGANYTFKLGLDLQGGTQLVYQGSLDKIDDSLRSEAMDSVRDVIERRVNAFGVSEPVVQVSGDDRLLVELPGVTDINEAVRQIGQTPLLEFREEDPNFSLPESGDTDINPDALFRPTALTGAQLQRADVVFNSQTSAISAPEVSLAFNNEGKELFKEITERNLGKRVAIYIDNQLLSAPVVQSVITDGRAVIQGNFTVEEARELATRLNSGALPVPIELISQQNVGPTLGRISVARSLVAGIIGFAAVALFMLVYYRLPGLFAVFALLIYTAISLTLFKIFNITLSLAGIAGFILSIGMAIDANILIFERTKEELRGGADVDTAIETGFKRAWSSIRDSNISSLITTVILGFFGTSIIRGFAITLSVGILVSMFTAITVTRTFLHAALALPGFHKPSTFGVKKITS